MTISQTVTNASGYSSALTGTVVATTQTMHKSGFLESIDQNATLIGLAFTAGTFLIFLVSKAFEMRLKWASHKSKR